MDVLPTGAEWVNVSHWPPAGARQLVFDDALPRWHHHPADEDGQCLAPDCGYTWPCPFAVQAEQVMDRCLTYWACLNVNRPWNRHAWLLDDVAQAGEGDLLVGPLREPGHPHVLRLTGWRHPLSGEGCQP